MLAFFLRILKIVLEELIKEIIKNNDMISNISFETMIKNNDTKCRSISITYKYYIRTNFIIKYSKNSKISREISNAKSLI